ncbi:MAG: LuxR C-terminal-related transcriptional regulator [Planctomycetaceae bacterium]
MSNQFWELLRSQPGVGVLIIDVEGRVLYANEQARAIYYGDDFNPVGLTIEDIEGQKFAAERMRVIREVIATGKPHVIRHIRGGRRTQATIWPMEPVPGQLPRIISITSQGLFDDATPADMPLMTSEFVDLGPLDVLTRREIEVMSLIGNGAPLKVIADLMGISQRSVERYRTDIARKLHVNSIAEIAQIVQRAGLEWKDSCNERLHRWHGNR